GNGAASLRSASDRGRLGAQRGCRADHRGPGDRAVRPGRRRARGRRSPALVHAPYPAGAPRGVGVPARFDRGNAPSGRERIFRAARRRRARVRRARAFVGPVDRRRHARRRPRRRRAGASMKIAYLLASSGLSGGAKVVFQQAEELGRRGHEVTVVSPEPPPDWFTLSAAAFEQSSSPSSRALAESEAVVATFWTTLDPAVRAAR